LLNNLELITIGLRLVLLSVWLLPGVSGSDKCTDV